jgi:hypothetical protein
MLGSDAETCVAPVYISREAARNYQPRMQTGKAPGQKHGHNRRTQTENKSLFASFSSEKEGISRFS